MMANNDTQWGWGDTNEGFQQGEDNLSGLFAVPTQSEGGGGRKAKKGKKSKKTLVGILVGVVAVALIVVFAVVKNATKHTGVDLNQKYSQYISNLKSGNLSTVGSMTGEGGSAYLAQEVVYSSNNPLYSDAKSAILSSAGYSYPQVKDNNLFSSSSIRKADLNKDGVEITRTLIDWKGTEVDSSLLQKSVSEWAKTDQGKKAAKSIAQGEKGAEKGDTQEGTKEGAEEGAERGGIGTLSANSPTYSKDTAEIAAIYLKNLVSKGDYKKISTKTNIDSLFDRKTGYLQASEDALLDKNLFSSEDFYNYLKKLSSRLWVMTPDKVKDIAEGAKGEKDNTGSMGGLLLSTSMEVPGRWKMDTSWVGAYKMTNGKTQTRPRSGDGSIMKPAVVGTPVTYAQGIEVTNDKGEKTTKQVPISVQLTEFRVGQDAIKWYESKDSRNRGFDPRSEVVQVGLVFTVTNLSNEEVTIHDDSSLANASGDVTGRTGSVFGLKDQVKLKPGESGNIESWTGTTGITDKYIIWGKSYQDAKKVKPAYFAVLKLADKDDVSGKSAEEMAGTAGACSNAKAGCSTTNTSGADKLKEGTVSDNSSKSDTSDEE